MKAKPLMPHPGIGSPNKKEDRGRKNILPLMNL
jgi:hypothetical protein